jgi:hypothetical protein
VHRLLEDIGCGIDGGVAELLPGLGGDSVWLFGLDGTLPPVEPGLPVSRLAAGLPAAAPGAQ